jgi:hypothetical protein
MHARMRNTNSYQPDDGTMAPTITPCHVVHAVGRAARRSAGDAGFELEHLPLPHRRQHVAAASAGGSGSGNVAAWQCAPLCCVCVVCVSRLIDFLQTSTQHRDAVSLALNFHTDARHSRHLHSHPLPALPLRVLLPYHRMAPPQPV